MNYLRFITASLFTLPLFAKAADGSLPEVSDIEDASGVIRAMNTITNWIFSGFLTIAVLYVLWAAFDFLRAQGNAEKFDQAKKSLLYAAIAIAIAVLSKSIVVIAAKLVGGNVTF